MRGGRHTLHLLAPYLGHEQRRHLLTLSHAYGGDDAGNAQPPAASVDLAAQS
jgi:hypothetical protein